MDNLNISKIQYDKVTNKRKLTKSHTHNYYELYYLKDGETAYFIGDEIFLLEPNDFIMVPKGMIHSTDSQACLYNERILITFYEDIIDERYKTLVHELCNCKLIHIPENRTAIFKELLHKISLEEDMSCELATLYILELIALLCRHKTEKTYSFRNTNQTIAGICDYIRENYSQQLSLHSIGRKFGMSESNLSRKFKSITGLGISEFITQVRIYNAEKLLIQKDMSITKVSELCGFSDSNYFATVFKKAKGITPYKYKTSY